MTTYKIWINGSGLFLIRFSVIGVTDWLNRKARLTADHYTVKSSTGLNMSGQEWLKTHTN